MPKKATVPSQRPSLYDGWYLAQGTSTLNLLASLRLVSNASPSNLMFTSSFMINLQFDNLSVPVGRWLHLADIKNCMMIIHYGTGGSISLRV